MIMKNLKVFYSKLSPEGCNCESPNRESLNFHIFFPPSLRILCQKIRHVELRPLQPLQGKNWILRKVFSKLWERYSIIGAMSNPSNFHHIYDSITRKTRIEAGQNWLLLQP